MRSNPCAPARRSNWRWKECRSAAAGAAGAAPGAAGATRWTGRGAGAAPGRGGRCDEECSRGTGAPIPPQDVAQVSTNWPAGNIDVRMANYLCQAQQKWTITAVPNAGGYPGSPYFKITIAGTDRALAATEDARTGRPARLHRRRPNNSGASTSSPTAPGASCPRRFPNSKEAAGAFGRSAAVSRRSPSSTPRATSNAGCSKRRSRQVGNPP